MGHVSVGDALFADPESDATRRTYFSGLLTETYRERFAAHVDTVENRTTALGADHIVVDVGEDFFDAFASVWPQ